MQFFEQSGQEVAGPRPLAVFGQALVVDIDYGNNGGVAGGA